MHGKRTLPWLLCLALLCSLAAGCGETAVEEEIPAVVETTVKGTLLSYDGETLVLDGEDGELRFAPDRQTVTDTARGFMTGDDFTVTYREEDGAVVVLRIASQAAKDDSGVVRGAITAIDTDRVRIQTADGDEYCFLLAGTAIDLWQGLRTGIVVELRYSGTLDGTDGSGVCADALCDHADGALLTTEKKPSAEPPAGGDGETEFGETEFGETEFGETPDGAPAWELEERADEVWTGAAVNVRLGPGMEYVRVGALAGGKKLARSGVSGDWSLVKAGETEGYVRTEYLLPEQPEQIYEISYDANGGVGAPSMQYKIRGSELRLSETVPLYGGHTFVAWNTSANGFGVTFAPGTEYGMDGDATLYAQWREGEPTPTPAPTPGEDGELPAEAPQPTETPAEEPVADTSSSIAGTLLELSGDTVRVDVGGETYEFDATGAAVRAERGIHPGNAVTVHHAGHIRGGKDCTRAPAVCVEAEPSAGRVSGTVTGVTADSVTLDVGGVSLYAATDAGAEIDASVTLTLTGDAPNGNLFEASDVAS